MYNLATIEDTVRVPPNRFKKFNENPKRVIASELENTLTGKVDKDAGVVLAVTNVKRIGEGRIVMGDGAFYYDVVLDVLAYKPVLHEIVSGLVTEITEFGAFVSFGPVDGLIHVSQITEDFMSYDSKNVQLAGKESKKILKAGDEVVARIVTVSLKDRAFSSKIGLTMRQPYLGKVEWIEEEIKKAEKVEEKEDVSKKVKVDKGKIKERLKK